MDAESRRGQQSLRNFQNNVDGIFAVYSGGDGYGADDFFSITINEAIAEENIQTSFDDVQAAIDVVFDPFSIAVETEFGLIRLGLLQGNTAVLAEGIETRIFPALTGSSSDFNFNDGD